MKRWTPSGQTVVLAIAIFFFTVVVGLVVSALVALYHREWLLAAVLVGGAVLVMEPWKIRR